MRDMLYELIKMRVGNIRRNGHPTHCLPNTLSLGFENCKASALLNAMPEVAASAGAACHAEDTEISATLLAMHTPLEYARGTLRFSTGKFTTKTQIERAAGVIANAVLHCRKIQ